VRGKLQTLYTNMCKIESTTLWDTHAGATSL
jgi:hypothetical protein